MRFISDEGFSYPVGWEDRAAEARQAVEAAEPTEKSAVINANAQVWRDIRPALAALSDGKCWYCETKEPRSDRATDHFRPKGRVSERKGHPGYWWLAFDSRNYRYSCTFCNSLRKSADDEPAGGKADHFPIVDEDRRACCPADSIDDELPYLLDPKREADPLSVTFDDDGSAVPAYAKEENQLAYARADTSIRIYHLNHPELREARLPICEEIKTLVKEGDRAFARQDENPGAALVAGESFESIVRRIKSMIHKGAEYSRTARAILRGYKASPWVVCILEDA